jgi:glycosyltransferase involved in cell wall biosynthesis
VAHRVLPFRGRGDRRRSRGPAAETGVHGLTPPRALERVGFLHLGRPESGVRRYGQLIADEAATRDGLTVLQADAGRIDEQAERLVEVARDLGDANVLLLQWNRRGWGTHGRSLARLLRFRRAYRGALVVTLHDVFGRHGVRQRWIAPDVWSLRMLGRTADRLVVHSQVEVERLRGIVPLEKLRVVPHFVERRTLRLGADEARERLGVADRRIVTLLGFVYGRKGHRYAVEAVPYLPDDVVMVYAGGPVAGRSYVHDLALQKATELELGDRFRITGYLSEEELETWIAATHLAILPFTDLSASGSLSSWISAGKPTLASDLPGFREYARRVPGALSLFGPPEPVPLATAINELMASPLPERDERVVELGRELSMERTVQRYLDVAHEAVAAAGRP